MGRRSGWTVPAALAVRADESAADIRKFWAMLPRARRREWRPENKPRDAGAFSSRSV
jgi:hypothetical protein